MKLRDRDYIVGLNGLIFRVLGYSHPSDGYLCDLEYVPSNLYTSSNPKAPRGYGVISHYKLYGDEPFKLVNERFSEYRIYYRPLNTYLPGVPLDLIREVKFPRERLIELVESPRDELSIALVEVLDRILSISRLGLEVFGVFGSLLFDFYHPNFSDLDFVVYGLGNLRELRDCLASLYKSSSICNEFENPPEDFKSKWRFRNYPYELFLAHQKRKLIYGVYKPLNSNRRIKFEFEPVKDYGEISDDYNYTVRIVRLGWIKAYATVLRDSEAAFIPSIYEVEIEEVVEGLKVDDVKRVVSYVEEYRLQAFRDERVYIEGWLERVETLNGSFHQITLTYGSRYYDQTLYSLDLLRAQTP